MGVAFSTYKKYGAQEEAEKEEAHQEYHIIPLRLARPKFKIAESNRLWLLNFKMEILPYIFILLICMALFVIFLRHFATCRAVCKSSARMTGKVVIITGGNSGIGKCTAIDLARRGAKVYIASEVSVTNGEAAAKEIQLESGNSSVYFRRLDLTSMKSVKEFAQDILEQESQIHVLINNAGVYLYNKRLTEDGFDATMTINYVGHYLLTLLLLERVKNSAPSRILVVTSLTHYLEFLDFDDMMLAKNENMTSYRALRAYSRSKLAVLMFARELGRKLEGSGITVCAVDPGMVNTPIVTNTQPLMFKV